MQRKQVTWGLVAALAAGALAAPVGSASGVRGCAAFGGHVSADAKELQPSGRVVRQFAPIAGHVHYDHAALC